MDINSLGIMNVASITVIAYLVGIAAKNIKNIPDNVIPVICGLSGAILGLISMYTMADFPVSDPVSAVAVGIVSGLASTGINQIYKQNFNK